MKINFIDFYINKPIKKGNNLFFIKYFAIFLSLLMSMMVSAQSNNKLMVNPFKANQSIAVGMTDYEFRCPITWRIDSVENLLTITPRLAWRDSITVSIHSFKTTVLPFTIFMKDPAVDFDAKTIITESNNAMVYKVISTKQCDTCTNQNKKREQYYSVPNNKVYILYFTASNKILKKYKEDLDLIMNSFELKY